MRNISNHDCIVAWSGGVESTALITQVLAEKKTPLIIHLEIYNNDYHTNQYQTLAVENMADRLDLRVEYIEHRSVIVDMKRSQDFWKQKKYGGGYPILPFWTSIVFLTQIVNPWCTDIYIGKHLQDGNADTWAVAQKYCEEQGRLFGFESRLSAPLEHLSKKEQWSLIPRDIKPLVRTCPANTITPCGVCSKCKEKEKLIDNT
jgi:7-cyano-7-deazaguanine synthase in queuosine biosynthesis